MAKLQSSYKFVPERGDKGEWVGIVYRRGLLGRVTVVTCACMATEQGIKLWLAAYLRTGVEPSDLYSEYTEGGE
jgi:hypothetical protein